jgi:hypothetical protein
MFVPHKIHTREPSRSITGIDLLFYICSYLTRNARVGLHCVTEITLLNYVYDILTSQETRMDLHGLLREQLYFPICRLCSYHRGNTYGPPRTVTGIATLFYMWMMFVSHKKHTYEPPRPVTGIALLYYVYMIFLPHRNHTLGLHGLLRG